MSSSNAGEKSNTGEKNDQPDPAFARMLLPRSWATELWNGPFGLWCLALLATLAAILKRALEPSLLGVWEGADRVITVVGVAAAGASQLVALGCSAAVIGLVLATVKSTQPLYLRASSVCVGMIVLLAVSLSSVNVSLPQTWTLVVAGAATLLALGSVLASARIFTLRAAALVLGGIAAAGLVRILAVVAATQAVDVVSERWEITARVAATFSWVLDAGATALAVVLLVTTPASPGARPRWGTLGVIVVLPALFVVGALVGADPEEAGLPALLKNMAHHLTILPQPYTPDVLRHYMEAARWVIAVAFLVLRPRSLLLAAAVTLALFSRATLEVPLSAAALIVAALSLGIHPGPDLRYEKLPHPGVSPRKG